MDVIAGEDASFLALLAQSKFVPTGGQPTTLQRPSQLFDPSVSFFMSLMDASCFPIEGDLRRPDCLGALRKLGLRCTLTRIAVRSTIVVIPHPLRRIDSFWVVWCGCAGVGVCAFDCGGVLKA
jgi:hypothetical protein